MQKILLISLAILATFATAQRRPGRLVRRPVAQGQAFVLDASRTVVVLDGPAGVIRLFQQGTGGGNNGNNGNNNGRRPRPRPRPRPTTTRPLIVTSTTTAPPPPATTQLPAATTQGPAATTQLPTLPAISDDPTEMVPLTTMMPMVSSTTMMPMVSSANGNTLEDRPTTVNEQ